MLGALVMLVAGCTRGEPPIFDAGAGGGAGARSAVPAAAPAPVVEAGASGAPSAGAGDAAASSPSNDAGALPQTRDRPEAKGVGFDARVAALWAGIVADDLELALPFFFPLAAYGQVKDVGNPAGDWRFRLVAAYAKDIHELHKEVGRGASFVSLEVPDARARWVEPGEEYNKLGYWRVYGTRLRWDTAGGGHRSADVKSLISWRGEWFVVHLSAIK
jgi:hypothetical protein